MLLTLDSDGGQRPSQDGGSEAPAQATAAPAEGPATITQTIVEREPAPPPPSSSNGAGGDHDAQVVVIGSGPRWVRGGVPRGRPRDQDVLVERYETLGGVCLNVGCIPSKAFLHAARVVTEAEEIAHHGSFGQTHDRSRQTPRLEGVGRGEADRRARRARQAAQGRGGHGRRLARRPETVGVGERTIQFENSIIAAGSEAAAKPGIPEDPRVFASTGALELPSIPKRMLVIGGDHRPRNGDRLRALGSKVTWSKCSKADPGLRP